MAFGPAILVGALMGVGAANAMTVTSPDIKPGAKIRRRAGVQRVGLHRQERVAGALLVGGAEGHEELRGQHV
jgi:hypothetical protein